MLNIALWFQKSHGVGGGETWNFEGREGDIAGALFPSLPCNWTHLCNVIKSGQLSTNSWGDRESIAGCQAAKFKPPMKWPTSNWNSWPSNSPPSVMDLIDSTQNNQFKFNTSVSVATNCLRDVNATHFMEICRHKTQEFVNKVCKGPNLQFWHFAMFLAANNEHQDSNCCIAIATKDSSCCIATRTGAPT